MARFDASHLSGTWIAWTSLLVAASGLAWGSGLFRSDPEPASPADRPAPDEMTVRPEPSDAPSEPEASSNEPGPSSKLPRTTPRHSQTTPSRPGQQGRREQIERREDLHPAVLRVITNFGKADVTVNGMPYPEYVEEDETDGMVLPAGGPYTVKVNYNGKTKVYTISLRPYRTRILMVELSGFKGGNVSNASTQSASSDRDQSETEGETGKVTVYSKPKGMILVDGKPRGQNTPSTIEIRPGRHDIQVRFGEGETSESKTVRVRQGSRIKLFFRKN